MIYITRFARRNENLRSSFEVISISMQTKIYKVYTNIVDSYRDIYSLAMFKTFNEMNIKKKNKNRFIESRVLNDLIFCKYFNNL